MVDRAILMAFGDTHGGHRKGLCNPKTVLVDYDPNGDRIYSNPNLTAMSNYQWEIFNEDCNKVTEIAGDDPVIALHAGDQGWGVKYVSEWYSTRQWDQVAIAVANWEPIYNIPNLLSVRLTTGTDSHDFGEGSITYNVWQMLNTDPAIDVQPAEHGLIEILGVSIDYAHKGPYTGSRNWLKGNVALYYLKSLQLDEIVLGNTPPDLVIRAHYHDYVEVYNRMNGYRSWLTVLPSYCGMSQFAIQATSSGYILRNGMVVYEIVGGKIREIIPLLHTLDIRTKEVIL